MCAKLQNYTYVCNRFNTSFCAKNHKTDEAISNLKRKVLKEIKPTNYFNNFYDLSLFYKVYIKVFLNQFMLIAIIYYFL